MYLLGEHQYDEYYLEIEENELLEKICPLNIENKFLMEKASS